MKKERSCFLALSNICWVVDFQLHCRIVERHFPPCILHVLVKHRKSLEDLRIEKTNLGSNNMESKRFENLRIVTIANYLFFLSSFSDGIKPV